MKRGTGTPAKRGRVAGESQSANPNERGASMKSDPLPLEQVNVALARLRRYYDHGIVLKILTGMLHDSDPAGDPYIQGLSQVVYAPTPLPAIERERIITAIAAAHGEAMPAAVHGWWALMEGATVEELQRVMVFVGAFSGTPNYADGLRTMWAMVNVLVGLAAGVPEPAGEVPGQDKLNVILKTAGALTAAFHPAD